MFINEFTLLPLSLWAFVNFVSNLSIFVYFPPVLQVKSSKNTLLQVYADRPEKPTGAMPNDPLKDGAP